MIHAIIFLVAVAILIYAVAKHSPTVEADVVADAKAVEADVKAGVAKVETEIKKL